MRLQQDGIMLGELLQIQGSTELESVKVTALFYDNGNKTVGVTTCCSTDPRTVEPGRTASFDSFAQEDEVSGTPTSFRLSFDWSQ